MLELEIEATAVERSYMDFRRRRERRKSDITSDGTNLLQTTAKDQFHTENKPDNSQQQTTAINSTKIDLEKFLTRYQNDLDIGQTHFKNKNTAAEIIKPIPEVFSEVNKNMHAAKHDYLSKPLTEFRKFYYSQSDRQVDDVENLPDPQLDDSSPDNQCSEEFKDRLSEIEKAAHKKEKELEMLGKNLSKIYNLQDEPTKETDDKPMKKTKGVDMLDKNLLRVEIEPTENENDVLLVENSVDSRAISKNESYDERLSTQMTIIVSPKLIEGLENDHEKSGRSASPEQEAHLTRKDVFNAIFNAAKDSSSNEIRLEPGNDQDSVIDQDEYADDFSADVDNYNSKAETDRDMDSRVSLPKTSEDEFWD
ncbi:hypothetical protein MSG28_009330 [Choristoneura fumiferana]|uniref:Uncharacterized protein n=1 Tax=Choristoneura fumiferana TaxID=7141 RepID=A0ACC0KXP4_CHOFU|nr:hypothetical protein MSG28_009330 [Choristoneura fumiferana]